MLVLAVLGYRTFQFEYTNDGWSVRFWKPAPSQVEKRAPHPAPVKMPESWPWILDDQREPAKTETPGKPEARQ
jgi:hypothetical protein